MNAPSFANDRLIQHCICNTCGVQFAAERPPTCCPVCEDERQYVGWAGQSWTTMSDLANRHRVIVREDGGLTAFGLAPAFAIDQRAILVPAVSGNILWESLSLVTDEAVAAIAERGGVDAIAISHPHFYAAMVEWSVALDNAPIYLHEADRAWVMRPHANIRFWSDDRLTLAEGVTLIRCGGHFPGSAALHWQDDRRPRGVLLPGDAAQVAHDRRHVAFLYSYPNMIPMRMADVSAMRERLRDLEFEQVYGYTWGRNILNNGRRAVDASFERHFRQLGVEASILGAA